MEEEYIGTISDKYSIISENKIGFYSTVYLVEDNKTKEQYAAKIFFTDNHFENEVKINKILKELNNPYIVEYIDSGNEEVTIDNYEPENNKYIIFDYYSKYDLYTYINLTGRLKEIYSKILFKKILETVQLLHSKGIYHLDFKLSNILLDNDFNPKICDFGLSKIGEKNEAKFKGNFGTEYYKPPQMDLGKEFEASKADIFSLGMSLFYLVTNSEPNEDFYELIKNKKINYEIISNRLSLKNINISDDFINLFLDMIAYDEKDRKNIDLILKHKWFDEINDLSKNKEKEKKLKEDYIKEFEKKEKKIDAQLKPTEEASENKNNRGESIKYFIFKEEKEKNIKIVDKNAKFDYYIRIKGNLDIINFMNDFAKEMYLLYDNVVAIGKGLKFNLTIKDNNKEKNKNEVNRNNNENKNRVLNQEKKNEKEVIIQIELLKINNTEYLLRFIKQKGKMTDYYQKLLKVMKYAKDFI